MSAAEPLRLRPLGAGELLDRAVHVYVRAFVPLAVVALACVVPDAIAEASHGKDFATVVSASVFATIAKAGPVGTAAPTLFYDPLASLPWTLVHLAIDVALEPVRAAALILIAIGACLGTRPSVRDALRAGLAFWRPLVVVLFAYVAAYVAAEGAVAFVAVAVTNVVRSAFHATVPTGAVDAVVAIVDLGPLLGAYFGCIVSSCICVCERSSARVAIRSTIERLSKRGERARRAYAFLTYVTLLTGMLVAFVLSFAALRFAFGSALAGDIVRSCSHPVAEVLIGLSIAYVAVFYLDMRVRDDAYDLQVAARALATAPG